MRLPHSMRIPYYKQTRPWSCGAASMRMVLASLGIRLAPKKLEALLGTSKTRGTWNESFPRTAETYKLTYLVGRNASVQDLTHFLKHGFRIIVGYLPPGWEEGHYAVIKRITRTRISLLDPIFGANHSYSLSYFSSIWKNDPQGDNERHWFFAIKK